MLRPMMFEEALDPAGRGRVKYLADNVRIER